VGSVQVKLSGGKNRSKLRKRKREKNSGKSRVKLRINKRRKEISGKSVGKAEEGWEK
jgi:hypothetical protein